MPKRATSTSFGAKSGNPPGRGPQKGAPNAGRRPKSLVLHLKSIRRDAQAQLALLAAARDPDSRSFATAWKVLSEYDDEKPPEKKQIVGPVNIHVSFSREGRRTTAS